MGRKRFASIACSASGPPPRESNQPTRRHVYFWSFSRFMGRRDGAGDGVDGPWMGRACGVSRPKPVSRFHRSGRLTVQRTSQRPFLPPLHSTINLLSETQFAPFLRGRGSPCRLVEDENPLQALIELDGNVSSKQSSLTEPSKRVQQLLLFSVWALSGLIHLTTSSGGPPLLLLPTFRHFQVVTMPRSPYF